MENIAIKVEHISKYYRIGLKETKYDTMGDAIVGWLKKPIRNFKRLKSLSSILDENDDDVFKAVNDVSFQVYKGEVLGIIGKNGAGKSTLLKLLSRITEPTKGKIEIYGRVASLLEVGTGFNPELTGRENIYLNGTILGMTKKEIDAKLEAIISFSGIEKFIETPVKRYSSGMKVRLAFSVAAHLDPEVLIIDEVLAVGDAEFQKKCLGKMQEVAGTQGRTVLFVSHDMSAVTTLCNRTILLEKGAIKNIGKTFDIITEYLQKNNTTESLLDIERIKGDQTFMVESIIVSSSENTYSSAMSGRPFYITVNLKSKLADEEISEVPIVDMRIENNVGQRLFWISNSLHANQTAANKKKIVFYFEKCQLVAGLYNITINVNYKNLTVDWLGNIADFEVVEGQYYDTGKLPPKQQGNFLLDFKVK
ncbi:MAG: polysaccharide ABC transporter ATP-binding protein [Chitinophagaceae bacterium]